MTSEQQFKAELSEIVMEFETLQNPDELTKLVDYLEGILDLYKELENYPITTLRNCIAQMRRYDATRTDIIGKLYSCIVVLDHIISKSAEN